MRHHRVSSEWLALLLAFLIVGFVALSLGAFNGSFSRGLRVLLTADRTGLVLEPYAKVKMRGVQVGRVLTVGGGTNQARIELEIDPRQIDRIPSNVDARINATSLFGAKYVELIYPSEPSAEHLSAGAVLKSQNVTVEVNTVFQHLVDLIKQIEPSKLNAVLSAVAQGVRGQGQQMGEAVIDANEVLMELNSRSETIRENWRTLEGVADTYSAAAQNILTILDAASTTSATVTDQQTRLDALLLATAGMAQAGIDLIAPNKDNLVTAINVLEPTTDLLMTYNPSLTCLLVGAKKTLDSGHADYTGGADGKSLIMDSALLLGDDPYRYPDNLPVVAAKGGPGGKPGCGSLPDVADNWPVRALIANTGFGTGLDYRPNPGIGFPGWANYFPVTRGVPEPPSVRELGGPAPGPIPYPGAPPYGAPQYAPDGTPLYPGVFPKP
ncbi:MCE family protein [Mycobacterium sp. ACS4331]|uniref:MCE family protein n=1 Tax=Mycobacterium sp. ACS4331 TaxID=1834121 RepID=UPI0007FBF828|nr:MCE family protein [Mycobacterium sp. ACS4331]OBF29731.1 MCE-family protein MCE3A [Mycobacterium sp. ACS4331]